MSPNELTVEQAHKALVEKTFSCVELVLACFESIDKNNGKLNAFITVVSQETALTRAREIDTMIARGEEIGLLAGIPFSVKDAICVSGVRSTGAAFILDNYIPPYTATTVSRLLDSGAIVIGKTNCDAFGHGASNENSSYGPVRNPHDNSRVAGGSSGGSGAAVASHMGVFSVAEDTGGSVRCPASFCGVVGLKVSYGRNSRYGAMPMASSLDTVGPITKSVFDAAAVEYVMAGHCRYDATTVHDDVPNYVAELKKDIRGLRVGVPKEYFTPDLPSTIAVSVENAVQRLQELGATVHQVSLPMTKYAVATYYILVPSEDSANLARLDGMRYGMRVQQDTLFDTYAQTRSHGFPDEVKRRIMIGTYTLSAGYYDAYYRKAQKVRTLIIEDFEHVFSKVDILITPTVPNTAFEVGAISNDPLAMYLQDVFVCPASVAGIPAISLPCGKDPQSLPIGVQLIGPRLREERILNVAYHLERALAFSEYGN